MVKSLGKNLLSTCEVVGSVDGNIRIQWLDQNKREVLENTGTTGSARVYIDKDGPRVRKLYVTKIEARDAGRYSCQVEVNNQMKEKFFELVLYKEITFDDAPSSQHPPVHRDSTIRCQVSGEPTPVVSWKFNDTMAIGSEGKGRYLIEKKGLLVKNITQADNGYYTCRAEVEADGRYDERRILVVVHVPPKVTKTIGQINGTEGELAVISCNASGFPRPLFKFSKDEKDLQSSERIKIDIESGRVTFQNLLKADEGQYTCKASNDVGENVGKGSLKVFVTPKIIEYRNITKNEQDTGVLTCRSQGDPNPSMSFRKEGQRDDYKLGSNEGGRITVTQKSPGHLELVIRKVGPSDRAGYHCLSKNGVGSDEVLGFLDVQYKPRFPTGQISTSHSWVGRVHNVTCLVEANPQAVIQWIRYDRILENNDTYRIFQMTDNSSLQIRVKDGDKNWIYGDYHCLAKNSKGESRHTVKLLKADVPEKPKVTLIESTANTLTLRLTPPLNNGGMEVIGYRVELNNTAYDYSTTTDHHQKNHTHLHHDNSWNKQHATFNRSVADVKIENLKARTRYTFRIMAKNEVGAGPSAYFNATTADKSKPHPIHIISPVQGSNSYQYKLVWDKPKTGGFPISEYEIKFRKAAVQANPEAALIEADQQGGSPDGWSVLTHRDNPVEPSLSHVITGLEPLTTYEVVIYAHNQLGRSEAGRTFKFRTNEVRIGSSSRASVSRYIQVHSLLQLGISLLCFKK